MLKAMRPIKKKKGNKQVGVVAGGFIPGALCGAVGVVASVGAGKYDCEAGVAPCPP